MIRNDSEVMSGLKNIIEWLQHDMLAQIKTEREVNFNLIEIKKLLFLI
jgi:hypothetical protein